ncbi:unnamed protein product [Adineta steineri]|uniref:Uncharacterized protein n=1 Tax=Adineta steineri TaxID=433720 RepID=A0A815JC15_9BILA|nr:unnamed protein product [Adineta steineri]CAF1543417.1 unnamed protein product [Adineta steineri]CAF1607217.1 unnamed protein product [Adineta steineri]CAF1658382.1 unnamed protein product [Adineta steineri]
MDKTNALNNRTDSTNYVRELKRFQPNNTFTVCIASEKSPCNIQIRYQTIELEDENPILFDQEIIPIEKYVLQGEFETHRSRQLILIMNNHVLHVQFGIE